MRLSHCWIVLLMVQSLMHTTCGIKTSACQGCSGSGDWVRLEGEPFCYQYSVNWADFEEQQMHCRRKGANLPMLKTASARDNFKAYVLPIAGDKEKYVFTGLRRKLLSTWPVAWTDWKWVDGSPLTQTIETFIGRPRTPAEMKMDMVYIGTVNQYYGTAGRADVTSQTYCQKWCPLPLPTNSEVEKEQNTDKGTGATTNQQGQGGTGGGLGLGVIIGIAAGGMMVLLLLIIAAVVLVKRKRAAGMQKPPGASESLQGGQSGTVTAKDDPGAGIGTKDLFCETEMDHGIGTKDLFNATQADNTSNTSLNLESAAK